MEIKFKAASLGLILALLLPCCFFTALAAEKADAVDFNKKGVISVTLKAEGAAEAGAELTAYRVADAVSKNDNLAFTFTEAFASFGGAPEDLQSAQDAKSLAAFAKENGVSGTKAVTDEDGGAVFNELPLGLYLVVQTNSVAAFSSCSPFLVFLPAEENGAWVYEIDATPKTDVTQLVEITVKKIWNDGNDASARPNSITVNLYDGSTRVKSADLNSSNSWSCTWEQMPKSDSYSVAEDDVSGYAASYSRDGYIFTVTNTPKLVQTGQLNWPVPVLAFCGAVLFALGWALFKGRKDA